VLANLLIGRNAVAQRLLRAMHFPREDFEHFDALLKGIANRTPERIEAALRGMRLLGQGGIARFVEAAMATQIADESVPAGELALTAVELQVLRAMAQGLSNQIIADDQRRTINTVRTHVSSILKKLGAVSRGEAVAIARRRELV
jgi:DNA-binding NarL/FixJ family response regulator